MAYRADRAVGSGWTHRTDRTLRSGRTDGTALTLRTHETVQAGDTLKTLQTALSSVSRCSRYALRTLNALNSALTAWSGRTLRSLLAARTLRTYRGFFYDVVRIRCDWHLAPRILYLLGRFFFGVRRAVIELLSLLCQGLRECGDSVRALHVRGDRVSGDTNERDKDDSGRYENASKAILRLSSSLEGFVDLYVTQVSPLLDLRDQPQ